jgi:hypothetical protein
MKTILRITGSFFEPFDCELINWPELNAGDLITLKIFEGRPYWLRIENRQFNPILNHCTLICRVDSAEISDFLAEAWKFGGAKKKGRLRVLDSDAWPKQG